MKDSTWNILTILALLGCVILGYVFLNIYSNPTGSMNPFRPPATPPFVQIPSSTTTLRSLPPVWTATEGGQVVLPSSTMPPTSTGFLLPTATNTATPTRTATLTPTRTRTPTVTNTPNKTATALSLFATHERQTAVAAASQTAQSFQLTDDCLATQDAGGTCP
jgi:hypothetical protein